MNSRKQYWWTKNAKNVCFFFHYDYISIATLQQLFFYSPGKSFKSMILPFCLSLTLSVSSNVPLLLQIYGRFRPCFIASCKDIALNFLPSFLVSSLISLSSYCSSNYRVRCCSYSLLEAMAIILFLAIAFKREKEWHLLLF